MKGVGLICYFSPVVANWEIKFLKIVSDSRERSLWSHDLTESKKTNDNIQ